VADFFAPVADCCLDGLEFSEVNAPNRLIREGIPQGGAAIFRLALVTIVALALANWRMQHMRIVGASD